MACSGTQPALTPCPFAPGREPCPVCRPDTRLREIGEIAPVPDLKDPPDPRKVLFWSGEGLPDEPPDPRSYVRCRPCDCTSGGAVEPWDAWDELNRRAYAKLRSARAPYPVAIIPGFHGGGFIASYRLKIGLKLLRAGWVAALLVSGGHQRGGHNEARYLVERAHQLADRYDVDVTDRILVEPCACRTITNLRNSLRMMAAMHLPHGLLVSDAQMSGQAATFSSNLDGLVARDLDCPVGRVAYLMGYTPLGRWGEDGNGCQAPITLTNNPVLFILPNRRLAMFWVSPFTPVGEKRLSALTCGAGSDRIASCEPDDQDPYEAACLSVRGQEGLACEP
jgi:hypothetical protein